MNYMEVATPPADRATKRDLKALDRLQRTHPMLAIKTWWALAHWHDSCSVVPHRHGELVEYSLKDALRCFVSPSLPEQLEELGLPEKVRD